MLRLYNTASRELDDFEPLNPPKVGVYTCGPTVYDYQHIGHMRRYLGDDILIRVLRLNGYDVKQVMNITDVGHLVSDADTGEDKMEKGSEKFGMSVWEIAKKFEKQFFHSMKLLHIKLPGIVMRATDYIKEQIELIEILEEKGFTYAISDGVYFDTSKLKDYGKLARQDLKDLKKGARVEVVKGKKNPTDFALWKFSPHGQKRQMEWESPWGIGFPGWHIECSAMSMKAFGPSLDIHTGGIDHIQIHHTNEIAQSEAASGKPFVKYWIHHNFLHVEDEKMSKSLGNFYTVDDVIEKGFAPLALRYLYLQTHYRQEMNFTWESLSAAQNALDNLNSHVALLHSESTKTNSKYMEKFKEALNDDLNAPRALAVLWEVLKAKISEGEKKATLLEMDEILGLDLHLTPKKEKVIIIPSEIQDMVLERHSLRKQKRYTQADHVRARINKLGYDVLDTAKGPLIKKLEN